MFYIIYKYFVADDVKSFRCVMKDSPCNYKFGLIAKFSTIIEKMDDYVHSGVLSLNGFQE